MQELRGLSAQERASFAEEMRDASADLRLAVQDSVFDAVAQMREEFGGMMAEMQRMTLAQAREPRRDLNVVLQRDLLSPRDAWESLGEGGFGAVFRAKYAGQDVAVKELHIASLTGRAWREFERETRFMARLRHPNVVGLYGVCDGGGPAGSRALMVLEYCGGGSLYDHLQEMEPDDEGSGVPLWKIHTWADQLVSGMMLLHGQDPPVMHRDIKSQNLLLTADGNMKIGDFGLAQARQ